MTYVVAISIGLLLAVLVYGGLTGRIKTTSGCCAAADPARDLRMRGAWGEPPSSD